MGTEIWVLGYRPNYKCYWDGELVHVFLLDGGLLRIREAEAR